LKTGDAECRYILEDIANRSKVEGLVKIDLSAQRECFFIAHEGHGIPAIEGISMYGRNCLGFCDPHCSIVCEEGFRVS